MAPVRFVGVIDIGKTNAKTAIVDVSCMQEIAVRTTPNRIINASPYPQFDIDNLWHFILTAFRELSREHVIDAISITAHGACAVLLDCEGKLAMPVLDYEHGGPDELASQYDEVRSGFSQTGSPRLPMGLNLGAQLFWQARTFPKAMKRVAHILTYPQYWAFRLTGIKASEVTSLACHTDLWNPWKNTYSDLAVSNGWAALMAPVHKAGDTLGTLLPEIADATGLSRSTPVMCGIHDSNASLYPHLVERPVPFSVVSSGTWVICMAVGGGQSRLDEARDTLVNVNAFGEPVPSARFMGGREFEILMRGHSLSDQADLATVLEKRLMLLPSVETRSGLFTGNAARWHFGEPMNDGERYTAVSCYLALMTSTCLSLAGAAGPTIVEGPFARNTNYLTMLAAATGRIVVTSTRASTGTSLGAALLAAGKEGGKEPHDTDDNVTVPMMDGQIDAYIKTWTSTILPMLEPHM